MTVSDGRSADAVRFTAYGSGAGVPGVVRVVRQLQPELVLRPFEDSFRGVRVAAGDLTGDGMLQIVTVPGSSGGPQVVVWVTAGSPGGTPVSVLSLPGLPDAGYRGGAFVAVGGGQFVVTPDSVPAFGNTFLQYSSAVLPDQTGLAPGAAAAGNTTAPPLARVFVSPQLLGQPAAAGLPRRLPVRHRGLGRRGVPQRGAGGGRPGPATAAAGGYGRCGSPRGK